MAGACARHAGNEGLAGAVVACVSRFRRLFSRAQVLAPSSLPPRRAPTAHTAMNSQCAQGGSTPPCAASAVGVAPVSGGCGVQNVSVGGAEGGATSAPSLSLALTAPTASTFAVASSTTAAAVADSSASGDDDNVPVASLAPRAKLHGAVCSCSKSFRRALPIFCRTDRPF